MEKLCCIVLHLIFGGLVTGVGIFLGFYIGLVAYQKIWLSTNSLSTEYDYVSITGAAIGGLYFLYLYMRRFVFKSIKLWKL